MFARGHRRANDVRHATGHMLIIPGGGVLQMCDMEGIGDRDVLCVWGN